MEIKVDEISRIIKEQIRDYDAKTVADETGQIVSVGDGEAAVLHVRLDPDKFSEWMDEPTVIARRVRRTQ